MTAFASSSPYAPVLRNRLLRRLLPGITLSSLGDGMSIVAISWLALDLAPSSQRGVWVGIAVAAHTLPSVLTAMALSPFLSGRHGAQLAGWDATLRALALGAIPVFYLFGALTIGLYVLLLTISSLLHSWGTAGRYTLIAEVLPEQHRLAGNAVMTTTAEFTGIVGPPLAGFLISIKGAVAVVAIDACTFAVLALSYRFVARAAEPTVSDETTESRRAGVDVIRRDRSLLGLLGLSFGFFLLFGPVYVALPIYVSQGLHASATLLGWYYTAFSVGAVVGGLTTGHLRRWPLWPTTIGITVAFGTSMLPVGLGAPTVVTLASLGIAGAIWAPYMPISMALFQRNVPTPALPQVLAAYSAIIVVSVPLGTVLGGPMVAALGARGALLACAVSIQVWGVLAAGLVLFRRTAAPGDTGSGSDDERRPGSEASQA